MKKGLLFLLLFFLIFGGVYLYKKSPQTLPKFSSQNQITVNPPTEKGEESTASEISQRLTLEVYQPKDKATVNSSTITVAGKTSALADVFVNEKELKADSNGNFSTNLNLDEGENIITVIVSDEQGNYAEKELTVTLETVE